MLRISRPLSELEAEDDQGRDGVKGYMELSGERRLDVGLLENACLIRRLSGILGALDSLALNFPPYIP